MLCKLTYRGQSRQVITTSNTANANLMVINRIFYVVSMKGDKISSAEKMASTEGERHASIRSGSTGKNSLGRR
ncbi:MAG: hypothetical protein WAL79_06895 [Nitrososphaeraceae archaeon]